MRNRIVAAVVATAVLLAVAPPAMAQSVEERPSQTEGFEERRAALLERIEERAGALAERRSLLESAAERIDGFVADVLAATSDEELRAAVANARADLDAIRDRAKQLAYVRLVDHVGDDIATFTARADRLAVAVESAAARGVDTSAAAAELAEALVDIEAAATQLAALPPEAGDEVDALMPSLRDAHATVHAGQAHLRVAFSLLVAAAGPPGRVAGETAAL